MKEKQVKKAFLRARLIAQALCTDLTEAEMADLQAWAATHPDHQLLLEDLSDSDRLYDMLVHFRKYQAAQKLEKINQRLFGTRPQPAC